MGVCVPFGMDQFVSKEVGNDHFLDQSRLEEVADTDSPSQANSAAFNINSMISR